MTTLSRLSKIGMALEVTNGTYVVPSFSVPFNNATYDSIQDPLRDESIRANDSVLQGMYQGPSHSTFDLETNAYPDVIGYWLRYIGPDTVTAATATTLSSPSIIGATSISTVATIPTGSTIRIDTTTNTEYAVTGVPTGAGPFAIPITSPAALTIAHSSGVAVTTQTTHTFKPTTASRPPSYSITVFDTIDTRGWAGMAMSELGIKIDPKATVTFMPKFVGGFEATQSTFSPTYSTFQPWLGWQWAHTNAGGTSTRGLSYDLTLKRAAEVIQSSDGTQGPRETFNGALEADGSYKAIFENLTDMNDYLNYTQRVVTAALTQPVQIGSNQIGGAVLQLTMTVGGVHKGTRDLGQTYMQAAFDISGIHNATDTGVVQAVLKNWQTAAF